jgi:ketosteroid isomerase-like protein
MIAGNDRTTDEAAIRDLVETWARAVRTKNLNEILANHSPDIVMFDLPPPIQSKGIEAYKKIPGICTSLGLMVILESLISAR